MILTINAQNTAEIPRSPIYCFVTQKREKIDEFLTTRRYYLSGSGAADTARGTF